MNPYFVFKQSRVLLWGNYYNQIQFDFVHIFIDFEIIEPSLKGFLDYLVSERIIKQILSKNKFETNNPIKNR